MFKNINEHIKLYNNEISAFLISLGSLLLLSFVAKPAISFIHIAGIFFLFYNYKSLKISDFKNTWIFWLVFLVIFILSIITLFNDITAPEKNTFLALKSITLSLYVLTFIGFIITLYSKNINRILIILLGSIIIFSIAGSINFILFPFERVTPLGGSIIMVCAFIIGSFALGISMLVFYKNKLFGIFILLISILTAINNAERSYIVAYTAMVIMSFLCIKYKHRLKIVLSATALFAILFYGIYHYSENFSDRFNVKHMIENIGTVWNTSPYEMCKYDNLDKFKKDCKEYIDAPQDLIWEHSSLARISMNKSMLLAIADTLFIPKSISFDNIRYLETYHKDNPLNMTYTDYGYNHSQVINTLFNYGLIGFIAILIFNVGLMYVSYKMLNDSAKTIYKIFGLFGILTILGICIFSLFDGLYNNVLSIIFIMYGIILGMWVRYKREL